ncbi:alpha/beta fold hydrolase [Micromonospora sp. HUAS LYJ1]|uniref:alpha/beta fold hydrolase n=1 Tax=Micromonospora sp. HUAS LYJ1 TaxID=3061626 RepID=UPI0026720229|nr:alpha/beta fold hydrolase [Micromonospora sp. HUAS LYJ1]WKU04508.1 alpha/beta fold hydrolase [Micromonospora sp. HUAS LYJ1]
MSLHPPGLTPAGRGRAALTVLAVLALVLGGHGLFRADAGLTARQVTVDGVPLTEVRADDDGAGAVRRQGVVIAHGFAGSARLMRPLADTVARRGAVALLLDFAGHGGNPAGLPGAGSDDTTSRATLAHDLAVAVAHLRGRPDVDPTRIVLVGHSMGAGAVTRYAAGHPDIAGTVAISLPDAGDLPDARPERLLLIVGGLEFPAFRATAEATARRGVGRRVVVVPGVEHISVLFAGRTHREVAAWVGGTGGAAPRPAARLVPAGLLLLGLGLGFAPLAAVLTGHRPPRPRRGRPVAPAPVVLAVGTAATGLGVLFAPVLPTTRLPLAVGGYLTGFLLVTGVLLAAARHWPLRLSATGPTLVAPAAGGGSVPATGGRAPLRPVVAALLLTGYAVAAVAVPIHLGLTWALPVGARWWLLPVVAAGCLVFLAGTEVLTQGRSWRYAAVGALAVPALGGAAVAGLAPGFVLLVVPLFVVLLGWQAAWAAVLRRVGAPRWAPAVVGAVVVAWPVATALPLS